MDCIKAQGIQPKIQETTAPMSDDIKAIYNYMKAIGWVFGCGVVFIGLVTSVYVVFK